MPNKTKLNQHHKKENSIVSSWLLVKNHNATSYIFLTEESYLPAYLLTIQIFSLSVEENSYIYLTFTMHQALL